MMNNEALVKEIAGIAGVIPGRGVEPCHRGTAKEIGSVRLPRKLGEALNDFGLDVGGCRVSTWTSLKDRLEGTTTVEVVASLGHRTTGKRLLTLLKNLSAHMEYSPDAEWRIRDLGHRIQFQIVRQGPSEADLSAAIAGQI